MSKMKKTLAAVLACAMAVSTSMVAFATDYGQGDVNVDSPADVKTPVIKVSVPTTMDTYLNTFSAGDDTGSQILTLKQEIINKSEVAVSVTVKASVEAGTGVEVKDKASAVVTDDLSYKNKDLYVEAVALSGSWADTGATSVLTPDTKIKYNPDNGGACYVDGANVTPWKAKKAVTETSAEVMTFALAKASMSTPADPFVADTLAANNKGTAAYRFMGSINPNATWADDTDVQLHVVYSIAGLGDTLYNNVVTNSVKYNGTGKQTNMVDTHIEKIQIKDSSGNALTSGITFTKNADGAYVAPTGLTIASTKDTVTVESIKSVEIVDGTGTVPSGNGMSYVKTTKALNVLATWVTVASAPLKDKDEVEVKVTFNITDTNRPVAEGADPLTDYIILTLKKQA